MCPNNMVKLHREGGCAQTIWPNCTGRAGVPKNIAKLHREGGRAQTIWANCQGRVEVLKQYGQRGRG